MNRGALLIASLLLAACPGAQEGPGGHGGDGGAIDPGGDGGAPGDGGGGGDGGSCAATCPLLFSYPAGSATSVELHGDFAPDGWRTGVPMARVGDRFEVTLDLPDGTVVLYKFVVDGTWITDPGNPETAPDGFGGANSVARASCGGCAPPDGYDWRDAILYFVLVDRFADGDPDNDAPLGLEPAADYQGGDLAGLRQKIEEGYFEGLGVNTLWLSSPLDNADGAGAGSDGHAYAGYHGYWPTDLDAVESRIGSEADLAAVVEAAHAHGLKVIVDYVMNHVHADSPIYQQHADWFWPNDNGAGGNCVCGDGCSWDDPDQRKRCWFTGYLPDFDFRNAAARDYSVSNAVGWAVSLGIDGFRLDAVKHIEDSWLLDLRSRLTAALAASGDERRLYLVGETYTGDRALIKYYVSPSTMLDGQFDFPLRAALLSTILRRAGSMQDLVAFLDSNQGYYGAGAVMSTFLGNHDVPRAIHLAEDAPLFGDWDDGKGRAWNDRPGLPGSANPFQRVAVAYALLMTTPGVPLVYYGDEIGMPGAGDPDNRRFMQWSGLSANQSWLRDRIAALAAIRAAHPALRRGSRSSLGVAADVYSYRMETAGDALIVVLNRGDGAATAPGIPDGSYRELISGETVTAPLTIGARAAMILQAL
jgi:glycosidase